MKTKSKTKPKPKKLGVAMNASAAAARTGLSLAQIKAAKAGGCDAFKPNGRINCDELLDWMRLHPDVLEMHGQLDKHVEEALRIRVDRLTREVRLAVLQKKFISRDEVGRRLLALGTEQKAILNDALPDRPELVDAICARMRALVEEWA
jgi:hypothetical protein